MPTPRGPIQTSEQLGVSNLRLLWRGLTVRCPACGHRHTHESFARLRPQCLECCLRFERIEGHSIGYIGLNTIVTFTVTFFVILGGAIATVPDIPTGGLSLTAVLTAGILPIAFLRPSHTLWTAIDLIMRPLRPGEIDPRYVVVDPEAGRWRRRRP